MRRAGFLTVLACLALPAAAAAQNPFGDVPNEPRPDEFIHWDAEAVAGFQGELDEALRNGEGIWGTPFTVVTALPRADHRPHSVQIIHRAGYTQPEIHTTKWDVYVILTGAGTVLMGGERVNWIEGQTPDEPTAAPRRRASLRGHRGRHPSRARAVVAPGGCPRGRLDHLCPDQRVRVTAGCTVPRPTIIRNTLAAYRPARKKGGLAT